MAVSSVPHVGKSLTATTEEANVVVNIKEIKLLSNDGVYDITFNFENDTTADNAFILKAREQIENWKIPVGTLYYKGGGSCAFRLIGTVI